MRVGLLLKRGKPEAVELARDLSGMLAGGMGTHDARVVTAEEGPGELDLLVVLGGDGTLLHGASLVADQGVPILGINLGHLGFLTSCPPERAREALAGALAGELVCEERMRLRVVLARQGGERVVRYACNDAVVSQGALARLLEFEAFLDGRPITLFRADGLILATPTGSTAYSLAAGGPILTPDLQAMVLTPICPHTLTNRPLVVPASSRLVVRLAAAEPSVLLTVDGQWAVQVGEHDRIEVHAANRPLRLLRPAAVTYFDILREKLHWGGGLPGNGK